MSENENRKDEVMETEPTEPTLDELKAKLEKLEAENIKLKSAQSNASADASKYKKQLQENMKYFLEAIMPSDPCRVHHGVPFRWLL